MATPDIEKADASTWEDTTSTSEIPVHLNALITRKLDTHIMPWLFGLWLLAFIDRSNIGNARIDGLASDLQLDGNKFNTALAVFYVPYICYHVPSNLVIKYFKAGYYLPTLLISWGIISLCTGFVRSYAGLLVVRFFLGLAEGGLLCGMIVYLAMFYPRHQLVYRITLFYCASPLSGAFGGLLAAGLAEIHTKGYNGWPFIFFIEGGITILFGLIMLFKLPHTPQDITFLTPREHSACLARMQHDAHGSNTSSDVSQESFSWHWVRLALLNINTILLSLTAFAIITPIYSFSLFLPTIIKSLGYTSVHVQLLTVPPNVCAFVTLLITGHFSDKLRLRGPLMILGCSLGIVGYIMLYISARPLTRYGGTFLVAVGIFPCGPLVMGWLANNLTPHYVRATGTGFQIMVANMAAFIATFTYLQKDAPRYRTGHAINLGMLALSIVFAIANISYCKWENKRRADGMRDHRLTESDEAKLGYRHPGFRYTI